MNETSLQTMQTKLQNAGVRSVGFFMSHSAKSALPSEVKREVVQLLQKHLNRDTVQFTRFDEALPIAEGTIC